MSLKTNLYITQVRNAKKQLPTQHDDPNCVLALRFCVRYTFFASGLLLLSTKDNVPALALTPFTVKGAYVGSYRLCDLNVTLQRYRLSRALTLKIAHPALPSFFACQSLRPVAF